MKDDKYKEQHTRSLLKELSNSEEFGPLMNMHFLGFSYTFGSRSFCLRTTFLLTFVAVGGGAAIFNPNNPRKYSSETLLSFS